MLLQVWWGASLSRLVGIRAVLAAPLIDIALSGHTSWQRFL